MRQSAGHGTFGVLCNAPFCGLRAYVSLVQQAEDCEGPVNICNRAICRPLPVLDLSCTLKVATF